jgi:hypothetical protein
MSKSGDLDLCPYKVGLGDHRGAVQDVFVGCVSFTPESRRDLALRVILFAIT